LKLQVFLIIGCVNTVESQRVDVDIEVQRQTKALNKENGPNCRLPTASNSSATIHGREDGLDEGIQHTID
jgi:hypothetical protein